MLEAIERRYLCSRSCYLFFGRMAPSPFPLSFMAVPIFMTFSSSPRMASIQKRCGRRQRSEIRGRHSAEVLGEDPTTSTSASTEVRPRIRALLRVLLPQLFGKTDDLLHEPILGLRPVKR